MNQVKTRPVFFSTFCCRLFHVSCVSMFPTPADTPNFHHAILFLFHGFPLLFSLFTFSLVFFLHFFYPFIKMYSCLQKLYILLPVVCFFPRPRGEACDPFPPWLWVTGRSSTSGHLFIEFVFACLCLLYYFSLAHIQSLFRHIYFVLLLIYLMLFVYNSGYFLAAKGSGHEVVTEGKLFHF